MYNVNYMDGVPVKIIEKYKPPPDIYKLPQSLTNKLNIEENFYWNSPIFSCDLYLEKKALSKIEQWKHIRQRNKEQRRERILKREEHRRQEDEDIQKKMLYCVSYPSTDDLSSEEEEMVGLSIEYKESSGAISEIKKTTTQLCGTENVNSFHNILQPTVLSFNSSSTTKSAIAPVLKSSFDSNISNSFNYKDFEDDTSSPFDNVELKTINDLDVLAQVLHNTQITSTTNENVEVISRDNINQDLDTCCSEQEQKKDFYSNSLMGAKNIPNPINIIPLFKYDNDSPQEALTYLRDNNVITNSAIHFKDNLPSSSFSQIHLYNGSNNFNGYCNFQLNASTNKTNSISPQLYGKQHALSDDQMTKSKSVPDILKELRDEVQKSESRRYRNCSYKLEDTTEQIDISFKNESAVKISDTSNEDVLSQLDCKAKQLVKQINAMGFPLKRVVRIVQLLGTDDKKVVEHLIPLSELADLGFEEIKISDALIRNDNNKNKALDDLIS